MRERNDWPKSVLTVAPAFAALGSELESVRSYTDGNCMRCGSCLQGCPTNAGKSTLNTYIHDAWAAGMLELRAGAHVERVVIEGGEATGVEYTNGDGTLQRVDAGAVVVAGGTLNSPQILMRSGLPDSPSSRLIGRNLGFHPARLVYGLFDEPQDAHMVYPITAHAMGHQHDEDGGFVIEATTIQDPIGFATTLEDENGPLWGAPLVEARARLPPLDRPARDGQRREQRQREHRRERRGVVRGVVQRARARAHRRRARLLAQGAARGRAPRACAGPGCITTHVQGTCRMGSDPERSVVDADAQSWDVKRLYVGDGSLVPHTLSVNPSLTIMALATRLAEHLARRPARVPRMSEPVRDLAHLSHIELLTPKPDESLYYFRELLGMEIAGESGDSIYLRCFGDYERSSLKLTASPQSGVGHLAYRTHTPEALERRVAALEAGGVEGAWLDGDLGHGRAYSFLDPDGHRMELFYESERYTAPPELRPALKNQPQPLPGARRRASATSTTSTSWPSIPARTASSASATWACG